MGSPSSITLVYDYRRFRARCHLRLPIWVAAPHQCALHALLRLLCPPSNPSERSLAPHHDADGPAVAQCQTLLVWLFMSPSRLPLIINSMNAPGLEDMPGGVLVIARGVC